MILNLPTESYLNTCEHQLNLKFDEILLLRNYSLTNNIKFCSSIGGCESIKDLQKSRFLGAEASEFPFIESKYALSKIFSSIDNVFMNNINYLKNYKLFINIGTLSGIKLLSELKDVVIPNNLKKNNIVFIFDIKEITKDINAIKNTKIDLNQNKMEINKFIFDAIYKLNNEGFSHCISGDINIQSLKVFNQKNLNKPKFIKLGLFTIVNTNKKFNDLISNINQLKLVESKLLQLILDSLIKKENNLRDRLEIIQDEINALL